MVSRGSRAVTCWKLCGLLLACGLSLLLPESAPAEVSAIAQPVHSFEVDAYETAHNIDRSDAAQAIALQHRGAGIVEQLQNVTGASYAGVWFDGKSGKFVVPVTDSRSIGAIRGLLASKGLNDEYRLDPVEFSWNELLALQIEVNKELTVEIGEDLIQTSVDPRRNAVVIHEAAGLGSGAEKEISRIRSRAGRSIVAESVPQGHFQAGPTACTTFTPPGPGQIPHRICDRPLRGGVFIEGFGGSSISQCSAGFAATGNLLGNHFLLTAGHCVQGAGHWRSEDAEQSWRYIGQVEAAMFPGRDYAAIRVKPGEPGIPNYWEGGEGWVSRVVSWGGSQNVPINYEASTYIGQQVCHSGTTTGTTCGTVINLNKTANYPSGTVHNLTEATFFTNFGDSGGSVWAGNTALGLVSGFSGSNSLFQEVTEAADAMQVTVGARLPSPPWAETGPATVVGGREATLQGEVDPAATLTEYRFDLGKNLAYGTTTPFASVGAGHNPIPVGQVVQQLSPLTEYHFRVLALNAAGTAFGKDMTFKTTTASPLARAPAASGQTTSAATLKGEVESGGLSTTYSFEYGETEAYGFVSGVGAVGSSTGWVGTSGLVVSGLKPETTYHYRLKATNSKGTTYSSDAKFTTLAKPASFLSSFGTPGAAPGQFNRPMGAAVDASGNVYVVDKDNNRVQKFNAKGEYLSSFGSAGSGNGQFKEPRSIAVDPTTGNLFVTDYGNGRVQQFSSSGAYLATLGSGTLILPYGVAVDSQGRLWVSDLTNKVIVFEIDRNNWVPTGTWTSVEGSPMSSPAGLAIDQQGDVWVPELGTQRISELVKQPSGTYIAQARVTSIGSGQGQISQPVDIEVKPSGNILVVERGNHRVQQLSQDGAYQASFAIKGSGAGQLNEPTAIGIGQGGVVFVTDSGNHRVQRWMLE